MNARFLAASLACLAFASFGFAVSGCASSATANDDEASADESADELSTTGVSTYYVARRDLRKCVSPLCGGWFVSRVNKTTTKCADGQYAASCYVAELDLSALGLDANGESDVESAIGAGADTTRVVFRGSVRAKSFSSFGNLGVFAASEAWTAADGATITGSFYKVSDSGIRCITAPCPSLREQKLNMSSKRNLTDLDLDGAPGTQSDKDDAAAAASTAGGAIFTGANAGSTLVASQYFTRVTAGLPAGATCGAGTASCGPGLLCCYPCGIRGCTNRCMAPAPGGGCPLFP